jgi:metallo-beta-lactamase class B
MKIFSCIFFQLSILCSLSSYAQQDEDLSLSVVPLTKEIFVHVSYKMLDGKPFPSNGLIINTEKEVVLVDAAWTNSQTEQLLSWINSNLKKRVGLAIISHSHDDRIGGIRILLDNGVKVISSNLTADRAERDGFPRPQSIVPMSDSTFTIGKTSIETFYPGRGHSPDNIVVWVNAQKVLFGGCLVKSTESKGLGNIADATISEWPVTIQQLVERYPGAVFVIPGHFGWKGNPLKHTLGLLKDLKTQLIF